MVKGRSVSHFTTRGDLAVLPFGWSSGWKLQTRVLYDVESTLTHGSLDVLVPPKVMHEWGSLFVLTGDGKMYQLSEKDFQTKLDMLFRKHLYEIAISLAKTQSTPSAMVEIYKVYRVLPVVSGSANDSLLAVACCMLSLRSPKHDESPVVCLLNRVVVRVAGCGYHTVGVIFKQCT